MVGAFWWVLVFRCLFCVCFLLVSLRLTSSLVAPFLGDCDNPVARACTLRHGHHQMSIDAEQRTDSRSAINESGMPQLERRALFFVLGSEVPTPFLFLSLFFLGKFSQREKRK